MRFAAAPAGPPPGVYTSAIDARALAETLRLKEDVVCIALAFMCSKDSVRKLSIFLRTPEATIRGDVRAFVESVNAHYRITLPSANEGNYLASLTRTYTQSYISAPLMIDGTLVAATGIRGGSRGYWSRHRRPEFNAVVVGDVRGYIRALHVVKGGVPDSPATRSAPWLMPKACSTRAPAKRLVARMKKL